MSAAQQGNSAGVVAQFLIISSPGRRNETKRNETKRNEQFSTVMKFSTPFGLFIALSYRISSVSPFASPSHRLKTRLPALQTSAPPVEVEDAVVVGEEDPMFLDVETMLAARPEGALSQSEMIQIVKNALLASGGIGLPEAMLTPDFSFEGGCRTFSKTVPGRPSGRFQGRL